MHTNRLFRLSLLLLLCATSGACIVIQDDDDASNDDGSTEGAMTTTPTTTEGSDQGRNVRLCEVRVVCQDGSITEAGQPLCLTAAETAMELGLIQEACIEDMTAACEDIEDGSSLECSAECSEAMEPCECQDPSQGCEI